ncbi:MAG: CheF family chemotaxis protein [Halobacteriaceae archaeon]
MAEGEQKLVDTRGRFTQVVKNGRELTDAGWTSGRVLLSNRRIVLAASAGKRDIPLSAVESLGGRYDHNQALASVGDYVAVTFGDNVVLVAAEDGEAFEDGLFRALLDRSVLLVRHPAVEGGVVQDTGWEKARIKLGDGVVNLALATGTFVEIELDDVGDVDTAERTVDGETRQVVEAEHTVDETSVWTYVSGPTRRCEFLRSLLARSVEETQASLDLDKTEREVLTALYSGVSPFEIPDFLGLDVDDAEEIFERLVDLDVLDEVRKRREVTLTARGRNIASESIGDQ